MNKYLVLLLLTCSTSQAFWCWRRKTDSPKIAPQPPPALYIAPQAHSIINDTKVFNAAKAALKLSKLDSAFEHFGSLTDQHKADLLKLFFIHNQNPEICSVGPAELLCITQACKVNSEILLTDRWQKYLHAKGI